MRCSEITSLATKVFSHPQLSGVEFRGHFGPLSPILHLSLLSRADDVFTPFSAEKYDPRSLVVVISFRGLEFSYLFWWRHSIRVISQTVFNQDCRPRAFFHMRF